MLPCLMTVTVVVVVVSVVVAVVVVVIVVVIVVAVTVWLEVQGKQMHAKFGENRCCILILQMSQKIDVACSSSLCLC